MKLLYCISSLNFGHQKQNLSESPTKTSSNETWRWPYYWQICECLCYSETRFFSNLQRKFIMYCTRDSKCILSNTTLKQNIHTFLYKLWTFFQTRMQQESFKNVKMFYNIHILWIFSYLSPAAYCHNRKQTEASRRQHCGPNYLIGPPMHTSGWNYSRN